MHPLAGVYAKLDRADEHLDALNQQWRDLMERDLKKFLGRPKLDMRSGWYEFSVGDFEPDLLPFAVGNGEVVYQLRSCLEQLVWALVKRSHREATDSHSFPIETKRVLTQEEFIREHRNGRLKGVPVKAIKLIEAYQPYRALDPDGYFLTIIQLFANVDKHRTIYTTYSAPDDPSQFRNAVYFRPPAGRVQTKMLVKRGQRLKPGTKIMRLRPLPIDLNRDVGVDGKVTLLVQVRESSRAPRGPEGNFRDHSAQVREMVEDFERHFF